MEDNAVGVTLHSSGGAATVLTQNSIRRQTGMMDSGIGVLSRESLANASIETITNNTVRDFGANGGIDVAEDNHARARDEKHCAAV